MCMYHHTACALMFTVKVSLFLILFYTEIVVGQHYSFDLSCVGPTISYGIDENVTVIAQDSTFLSGEFSFGYICRNSTGYEV